MFFSLDELLDYDYQFADTKKEKQVIVKNITKYLFRTESQVHYQKYHRTKRYKIHKQHLMQRQDLIDLFEQYNNMSYVKLTKAYDPKVIEGVDFIKVKLQNLYGFYCDMEIIDNREYSRLISIPKREYLNIIKRVNLSDSMGLSTFEYKRMLQKESKLMKEKEYYAYIEDQIKRNIELVDYEAVRGRIETALAKAEVIKQAELDKKVDMTWVEFKELAVSFFPKIFDSYDCEWMGNKKTYNDKLHIFDQYIMEKSVGYINRSLKGYIYNHFIYNVRNMKRCEKNGRYQLFCLNGIKEKYHPLQLCVSKFYGSEEELMAINIEDSLKKLTNKQREFIENLTYIINDNTEKDLFLFNVNGLPKINEGFISKLLPRDIKRINDMIRVINKRIKF